MTDKIESRQIFLNTQYGLQRIFTAINGTSADGVTEESLETAEGLSLLDTPFIQFLQSNITNTDKNSDGKISEDEFTKMLSSIQTNGLTYDQLYTMALTSGTTADKTLLETVMANFNKIDANNDGKVSQAEIDVYNIDNEIASKEEELNEITASDFSIFYGDSDSDSDSGLIEENDSV